MKAGVLELAFKGHSLASAVRRGKGAVKGEHRPLIDTKTVAITDSLDFDAALKPSAGNDPRYDYVLGLRGTIDRIDAVEVHPATSGDVKRVIAKCDWSRRYLDGCAVGVRYWHWISTNRIGFRRGGHEERRLRVAGVQFPVKRLVLR